MGIAQSFVPAQNPTLRLSTEKDTFLEEQKSRTLLENTPYRPVVLAVSGTWSQVTRRRHPFHLDAHFWLTRGLHQCAPRERQILTLN